VKGGGIQIRDGQWQSTDRYGDTYDIKNPYDQVTASKHALLRFLSNKISFGHRIRLGHAVAFPDTSLSRLCSPYATVEITLDVDRLTSIGRFVAGVVRHWSLDAPISASTMKEVVAALRPTLSIPVALRSTFGHIRTQLVELTAEQIRVLA